MPTTDTDRLRLVLISGPAFMDLFARGCGLFEDCKRYGTVQTILVELTEPAANRQQLEKIVRAAKQASENNGDVVSAVFIEHTDVAYIDKSVRLASNGRNFARLADLLAGNGFTGEIPEEIQ